MFEILYEDNHIIVAEKPQNMIIAGDDTGDASMFAVLKEYIRVKYNKPGDAYLGLGPPRRRLGGIRANLQGGRKA